MKETIYLTRDESNIIKGILILLIVLGHNHFLMDGEYVRLQIQLYKFHVIEFFILPFFYKMKADTSWEHLRDIIVRNWVPYLWILSACYLTSCIYFHKIGLEWGHISAILLGTQTRVPMGSTLLVPTFFLLLLALLPHLNFKWLKTIGENSLGIYLFNMFIINILCALLPNNLITGVFIFIVSVCLSLFISICINKRMFLKRILFPSSIKDIKNCFNTK